MSMLHDDSDATSNDLLRDIVLNYQIIAQSATLSVREEMNAIRWNWPVWLSHLIWLGHKCPRCNSLEFKPVALGPVGRGARHVCAAARALLVLMAAVLPVRLSSYEPGLTPGKSG
jgi:hypothetical protein